MLSTDSLLKEAEFREAFQKAREFQVHWCPIIDCGPDSTQRGDSDVFQQRREESRAIRNFELGCHLEAARHLCPDIENGAEIAAIALEYYCHKDCQQRFRLCLAENRLQEDTLKFVRRGSAIHSLGIWEEKRSSGQGQALRTNENLEDLESQKELLQTWEWRPEWSVVGTYKQGCDFNEFRKYLKDFRTSMLQQQIYITLDDVGYYFGDERSTRTPGDFSSGFPVKRWSLRAGSCTAKDQVQHLLNALNSCCDSLKHLDSWREGVTVGEVLLDEMEGSEGGLGATFLLPSDAGSLDVSISGSGVFLFDHFFDPFLHDGGHLLDVSPRRGNGGEVRYRLHDKTDPKGHRCLCGSFYPRHTAQDGPARLVPLRAAQRRWIESQYEGEKGMRAKAWAWKLLSLPSFYFSQDPSKLTEKTRKRDFAHYAREKRRMRERTRRKWKSVMRRFA